jgi:hypoxanthine phosphoribosyltransferase
VRRTTPAQGCGTECLPRAIESPGERKVRKELLIPRETIQNRVKELAHQISSNYRGRETVCIGVLNGVVFFFADLLRELEIDVTMDFVRAASYGSRMSSSGTIRLTKDVELPIGGKSVILVEDIVDTGLTLTRIIQTLGKKHPESLEVCVLIDKMERREKAVHIDYCGFQIQEGFVVGYGLDFDEQFRYLPDIYVLR